MINIFCPICREKLNLVTFTCGNDHHFTKEEGVLSLLSPHFALELQQFLEVFEPYREKTGRRLTDPDIYPGLPFNRQDELEWRLRTYDVAMIEQVLAGREDCRILDIGAWNGWLSNVLAGRGHAVTAIDYFTDPYDGLRAHCFYSTTWTPIQMDLRDLSVLDADFDLVIINRCLQFFADPPAYVAEARQKVASDGLLLLTGLSFFRNPAGKKAQMAAFHREMARHDITPFKPMKGYLDQQDQRRLRAAGVRLSPYPQLWRANLKARFRPGAPAYYYGLWAHDQG